MVAWPSTTTVSALKGCAGIAGSFQVERQDHGLRVPVGHHFHGIDHVLDEEEAPAARLLLAGQLGLDVRFLGLRDRRR